MIRLASSADLPALRDLERAAGRWFREIGMAAVADEEPATLAELTIYQRAGRAWVHTDEYDRPIGYLLAEIVDGTAHIAQVSVHPRYARRGIGGRLIDTVDAWARRTGLDTLTLTTFAEVPWNAPYYRRLGFRVLPDAEVTAGLRVIRSAEQARGLDAWPRVVMTRPVSGG